MEISSGYIIRRENEQRRYYVVSVDGVDSATVIDLVGFTAVDVFPQSKLDQQHFIVIGHVDPLAATVRGLEDEHGKMKPEVKEALYPYLSDYLKLKG